MKEDELAGVTLRDGVRRFDGNFEHRSVLELIGDGFVARCTLGARWFWGVGDGLAGLADHDVEDLGEEE